MKAKRLQLGASLLIVVAALSLSACGAPAGGAPAKNPAPLSDTGSASSAQSPTAQSPAPASGAAVPPAAATGGEIPVTLRNHHFPEEIRVKVGAKVVFVIKNEGDETHSFEFPDFKVYKEINPGQTIRLEWTVPDRKGKWDMGCFLTDPPGVHDGMEGTLIID